MGVSTSLVLGSDLHLRWSRTMLTQTQGPVTQFRVMQRSTSQQTAQCRSISERPFFASPRDPFIDLPHDLRVPKGRDLLTVRSGGLAVI